MKSLICVICPYSHSFLVCKLYNSCLQFMHLLLDHLRFMGSVQLEVFSSCNIKKSQFQFLVSTACCFFNYICWSVNCMSWVSKFNNFFLRCTETETRFIFEFFKYCALWKVHFQHSNTFLTFLSGLSVVQGKSLICKLCITFWKCRDTETLFILKVLECI